MDLKVLRQSDDTVVILPGAVVVGNVTFGPNCSVWFNAVLRGDGKPISLGACVNIQDNAVLELQGRHDPCVVHRAVPVIEAAAALAACELLGL